MAHGADSGRTRSPSQYHPLMHERSNTSRRSFAAFVFSVLALLAAVAAVTVPRATAVTNCTPTSSWGTNRADLASQVVSLINQYRASIGRSQLSVSSTLTASSTWKSLHMAGNGYFAHDDPAPPVARGAYQRAKDCGFTGNDLGREHRLRVPHGAVGRERLARLRRAQGEHREPQLHLDRRRRGGSLERPALLDAELRQRRLGGHTGTGTGTGTYTGTDADACAHIRRQLRRRHPPRP